MSKRSQTAVVIVTALCLVALVVWTIPSNDIQTRIRGNRLGRLLYRTPPSWMARMPILAHLSSRHFEQRLQAFKDAGAAGLDLTDDLIFVLENAGEPMEIRIAALQLLEALGCPKSRIRKALDGLRSDDRMYQIATSWKRREDRRDLKELQGYMLNNPGPTNELPMTPAQAESLLDFKSTQMRISP